MGRKHCGKRRNCSFRAISRFPTVFSIDWCCMTHKNQGLFGKGLRIKNVVVAQNNNDRHYKAIAWKKLIQFCRLINTTVTFSQISPGFYKSSVQVLSKHCGKWRNCTLQSISAFFTSVFCPFGELSAVFIKCQIVCLFPLLVIFLIFSSAIKLLSANSLSLKESQICRLRQG